MCSKDNYTINRDGSILSMRGVKMSPAISAKGYYKVVLCRKTVEVHRAVAERFIPNPDNKCCVNHKDGDKGNNSVSNLEWVTHDENMKHAAETGLMQKGTERPNAKMNCEYVLTARTLHRFGHSINKLAKEFGLNAGAMSQIINFQRWKHCN